MKKAIAILQKMKSSEKHYKQKAKMLAKIIRDPHTGHILPSGLYNWAIKNKLKVTEHATDGCIWDTVSGR